MVTQFFLSFFKTFMDFMLLYVDNFCLGKVTEASLSGLELPGLEELELALIVLRTLGRLKHLSFPKRWSFAMRWRSAMRWSSIGSTGTFGQLMCQGLLYLSTLQGVLPTRPQGQVSVLRRSHLILRPLYYLAVHHLPGSHFIFLSFKIE